MPPYPEPRRQDAALRLLDSFVVDTDQGHMLTSELGLPYRDVARVPQPFADLFRRLSYANMSTARQDECGHEERLRRAPAGATASVVSPCGRARASRCVHHCARRSSPRIRVGDAHTGSVLVVDLPARDVGHENRLPRHVSAPSSLETTDLGRSSAPLPTHPWRGPRSVGFASVSSPAIVIRNGQPGDGHGLARLHMEMATYYKDLLFGCHADMRSVPRLPSLPSLSTRC
jgi:hypothetical protein